VTHRSGWLGWRRRRSIHALHLFVTLWPPARTTALSWTCATLDACCCVDSGSRGACRHLYAYPPGSEARRGGTGPRRPACRRGCAIDRKRRLLSADREAGDRFHAACRRGCAIDRKRRLLSADRDPSLSSRFDGEAHLSVEALGAESERKRDPAREPPGLSPGRWSCRGCCFAAAGDQKATAGATASPVR
jgi:hypothetical protein